MEKPNYVGIIQGRAGSGKSTLLKQHAAAVCDDGGWAFVHDPDKQFAVDQGGPFAHFATAHEWRRNFAAWRAGELEAMPRGASIGDAGDGPVTDLALQVAASQPKPVLVGYDEAVLVEASASYVPPKLRNLLARRRHLNVMIEILCQDFGLLHALWQRLATHVYLFTCADLERIKVIAKRFDVDAKALAAACSEERLGEKFRYVQVEPGKIVS